MGFGGSRTCGGGKIILGVSLMSGEYLSIYRGGIRVGCAMRGSQAWGRPTGLWNPWESPNPNLCTTNSQIFPNHQKRPQKYFSTAASLWLREIPSWGLFRRSGGGGINHGGPLHQPYCPTHDAWVVYHRPTGPLLVARWLILSLWSLILCSPRCSWSSIWCILLLWCVC